MATTHTHALPTVPEDHVLHVEIEHPKASAEQPARQAITAHSLAATAAASVGYNTNGWDTVYVIRLTDVNKAIAKSAVSPTTWSGKIPASLFSPEIDGTGTFSTWSLATGGSGSIVRMHVPFTAKITASGQEIDVAGGVAYIEVKLAYIPQPPTKNGTPQKLNVRTTGGSPDDPVVTVSSVTYTSPGTTDALNNALTQLLAQWFNANLDKFEYVFAVVNLGEKAASGGFQWLYPTYTSYAYIDNANMDEALLGVLCMTEGNDPTSAVQEISAGAIPEGARASFNMSLERFMKKMVLPALPAEFPNASTSTFQLSNDNTQISAISSFKLSPVNVAGVNYTPEVTTFTITLNQSTLQTYAYIHTPVSPGIDAYSEVTYYTTLKLGTKADGTQSLTYQDTQSPDKKSWYTVASWVTGVEIAADVILAVASAVVSGVTVAVEKVVYRVIIALVVGGVVSAIVGVLEKVPEWIAGSVPDAVPSVDALVSNATATTTWTDSKDFTLTTILLNGGMQMGGNPFPS